MRNRIFLHLFLAALLSVSLSVFTCEGRDVLVEAESFTEKGGWKVDQQFMDQMGSPYLLAHGMGVPVEDACTDIDLKKGSGMSGSAHTTGPLRGIRAKARVHSVWR